MIPVDGFTLETEAHFVDGDGAPAAVVCHPHPAFGGRLDTPLVVALADGLAAAGFSTVRFNFRGRGASGGRPTGGLEEHRDVAAALDWTRAHGARTLVLVGYSFGALMAMKAVAHGAAPDVMISVGFPTTILGDDARRLADVARALDRNLPWLFVTGHHDPFCELDRLRDWIAPHPRARLELMAGGHFFENQTADLVDEVVRFTRASVASTPAR
jgi:alpha/beta superfamily hydrolase